MSCFPGWSSVHWALPLTSFWAPGMARRQPWACKWVSHKSSLETAKLPISQPGRQRSQETHSDRRGSRAGAEKGPSQLPPRSREALLNTRGLLTPCQGPRTRGRGACPLHLHAAATPGCCVLTDAAPRGGEKTNAPGKPEPFSEGPAGFHSRRSGLWRNGKGGLGRGR